MAPPIPIGQFIPPVTGVNGLLAPVANSFDMTGNFRPRSTSQKRRRGESGAALDAAFDLSADYPALRPPAVPVLDRGTIQELLVTAAHVGSDMALLLTDETLDPRSRSLATSMISLYKLVEGIVEKGLMPLCESASAAGTVGGQAVRAHRTANSPPVAPKPTGERELREALDRADRESVLFDANLGPSPVYNRARLSAALSAGLKSAVVGAAEEGQAAEAVRVLDDAFGGVEDVDFLGQATKPFNNNRDPKDPRNNTFCTLPVKLRFTDRSSRIYFENNLRSLCGMRATQSFPQQIRKEMTRFSTYLKAVNPDNIISIRPDTRSMRLNAFYKLEGGTTWTRHPISHPIPLDIMLPSYTAAPFDTADLESAANLGGGGMEEGQ